MPQPSNTKQEQEREVARTVALPKDILTALDARRETIKVQSEAAFGIKVAPTRAVLVHSILREALGLDTPDGK